MSEVKYEKWMASDEFECMVSDQGRIIQCGEFVKKYPAQGYEVVWITQKKHKRRFSVHAIVLKTFRPNKHPLFYNQVDHINRCRKDNRLVNLRWADQTLNNLNKGYLGVSHTPWGWRARLMVQKKEKTIGWYKSKADAIFARDDALYDAIDKYDVYGEFKKYQVVLRRGLDFPVESQV